jgi:hypothetical protein
MPLPTFVVDILVPRFTPTQLKLIEEQWDRYADISFGNATKGQLVRTAKMVLQCASQ